MDFRGGELYTGLAARCWGRYGLTGFDPNPAEDILFFRRMVERFGTPALDVGCGTGRTLLPALRDGLEVEGCDISADMLAMCRENGARYGLTSTLYHQGMQELDLPRRYRTIYIPCGSFMCITDREEAKEALRRLRLHLEPDGMLVFNIYLPWEDYFSPGSYAPPEWRLRAEYDFPETDEKIILYRIVDEIDRVQQLEWERRRFEWWRGGQKAGEEMLPGLTRWYFAHEMQLMLEQAGFRDIAITGDYTEEPLSVAHKSVMVCRARP
jgi:SAM-dependent methyltransferase